MRNCRACAIAVSSQRDAARPFPGSIPGSTRQHSARSTASLASSQRCSAAARLRSTSARVFISSLTDGPPLAFGAASMGVDLGAPLRKPGDLGLGLRSLLAQSLIALAQLG